MTKRNWDIELNNVEEVVRAKLDEGPQLCYVLSKEIKPDTIYNLAKNHYLFSTEVNDEDRLVILAGAFKDHVDMKPDPEKTQKVFGRQVNEEIHDDLLHIDEVPYLPFAKTLNKKIIDRMRAVYDIRDIEHNTETRPAVLGCYFDVNDVPQRPGRVTSQSDPRYN